MKTECLNFKFKRNVRGCGWLRWGLGVVERGWSERGNREKRERHSGRGVK